MAKVTLTDLSGGYQSASVTNANNDALETFSDNCLSLDGTAPNALGANIDMNSYKVTNLADGTNNQDAVSVAQLNAAASTITSATALTVSVTDSGGYWTATNVEGVLAEIGAAGYATALSDFSITATAAELNFLDASLKEVVQGNVLIRGASDYEWRPLVENDISDLGTYLTDVVSDTTPQLGGDLDTNGNNIAGTGSINMVPLSRSISASGNTAATDRGILIALTGGTGQTLTLDADPPTDAIVLIDNRSGNSWTIAASVSLIWAKDATTGNRTLADDGLAVAIHRGSGTWIINGSALLT